MDKFQEFFKVFKMTLTNCSFYVQTHPKFIDSLKDFQVKLNSLMEGESSLTLKIKPDSLIVMDKVFIEDVFCKDLAEALHFKKIKSITFFKNLSIEDLSEFMLGVAANKDVILAKGGLSKILVSKGISSIQIETLDYSKLLDGAGEEIKDAWDYLLNPKEIEQKFTNPQGFSSELRKFFEIYGVKEILCEEIRTGQLLEILIKLKDKDEEAYKKALFCLSRNILKTKNITWRGDPLQIKNLLSDVTPQDINDVVLSLFSAGQNIEPASFELFSSYIEPDIHEESAKLLEIEVLKKQKNIDIEKIKDLFSSMQDNCNTAFYRRKLAFSKVTEIKEFFVDYDHLYENYRLILLEMFLQETHIKRINTILEKIAAQLQEPAFKNSDYFDAFKQIYDQKILDETLKDSLVLISQKIWAYAEKDHFNYEDAKHFNYLLESLDTSSLSEQYYIDRIFQDYKFNVLTLRLFFRFFPGLVFEFYLQLENKRKEEKFIRKLIDSLSEIDDISSLEVLKHFFANSSMIERIELLDVFKRFSIYDKEFLINLTKSDNFALRKKSVEVAAKYKMMNKEIVRSLFSSHYYFGFNNKLVFEDLDILEDIYIPEAIPYLVELTKDILFWNRPLREKAKSILEKYHDRTN